MPSVLDSLLDTTVTTIKDLDLKGLKDSSIKRLKSVLDRDFPTPGIGVAPLGPEMIDPAGVNAKDDVTYQIVVAIKTADNLIQTANDDGETQYTWRQRIRRRFHHQPGGTFAFSAISDATTCTVKPLKIIDEDVWASEKLFVSALVLNIVCREPRTYSA